MFNFIQIKSDVTLEDAMMLAGKIKEKDAGLFFQMLLKTAQDGPLSEEELSWQVLKLIMEWKEVKKGFSKRELVRILLGTKAGVLCNSTQEQRERFRLLARNLDIQCKLMLDRYNYIYFYTDQQNIGGARVL